MLPATLVFISILVDLNSKACLFVVLPAPDVLRGGAPLASFKGAILEFGLLLDPVDCRSRAIFIRLFIVSRGVSLGRVTFSKAVRLPVAFLKRSGSLWICCDHYMTNGSTFF